MDKIAIYKSNSLNNMFDYCCSWPEFMHNSEYFILTEPGTTITICPPGDFEEIFKIYDKNIDEKYFFPIIFSKWILFEKLEHICIPHDVIIDIKNNKAKIILSNVFEGWPNHYWLKAINFLIAKYNFTNSSFVVLNGNASLFPTEYHHVYYNHWEKHMFYELDNLVNSKLKYKKNRKHKFICLNRRPQDYRAALITLLEDIENKGILTFNPEVDNDKGVFFKNRLKRFEVQYPKLFKIFEKRNVKSRLPKIYNDGINAAVENPTNDRSPYKFYDTYLHVVPETYHYNSEGQIFYSEKIFKPIIYFQPFILVSQTHSLKHFKNFGYKTFENWIDESYDDILDNEKRLIQTTKIIKNFVNKSNKELDNIIVEMTPILEHNFQNLIYRSKNLNFKLKHDLYKIINA